MNCHLRIATLIFVILSSDIKAMINQEIVIPRTQKITDLVVRNYDGEYISQKSLVSKYVQFKDQDNNQIYKPCRWLTYDDIPKHLQKNIENEYYDALTWTYLTTQAAATDSFFAVLQKFGMPCSENKFEILRANIKSFLFIQAAAALPQDMVKSILPYLHNSFCCYLENMWVKSFKKTCKKSKNKLDDHGGAKVMRTTCSKQAYITGNAPVVLDKYTIQVCDNILKISASDTKEIIITTNTLASDINKLCLADPFLCCIKIERRDPADNQSHIVAGTLHDIYNITDGTVAIDRSKRRFYSYQRHWHNPLCDMVHGLMVLESNSLLYIISTVTQRELECKRWRYPYEFQSAFDTATGEIVFEYEVHFVGEDFKTVKTKILTPQLNIFDYYKSLDVTMKNLTLLDFLAAQCAWLYHRDKPSSQYI